MDSSKRSLQAAAFWNWFSQNASLIGRLLNDSDSHHIDELLSPRVRSLGEGIRWEVGPGVETEYRFSLSPNGNRDRLRLTDAIVAAAPNVIGWKFHSGKPPKQWDLRLNVRDVPIDARPWQYLLTGYNDGEFYDVTLVAPNLPASIDDLRDLAGYLVLEGILGERVVIERIGRIELVSDVPQSSVDRLSDIAVLASHLRHLDDAFWAAEKGSRTPPLFSRP